MEAYENEPDAPCPWIARGDRPIHTFYPRHAEACLRVIPGAFRAPAPELRGRRPVFLLGPGTPQMNLGFLDAGREAEVRAAEDETPGAPPAVFQVIGPEDNPKVIHHLARVRPWVIERLRPETPKVEVQRTKDLSQQLEKAIERRLSEARRLQLEFANRPREGAGDLHDGRTVGGAAGRRTGDPTRRALAATPRLRATGDPRAGDRLMRQQRGDRPAARSRGVHGSDLAQGAPALGDPSGASPGVPQPSAAFRRGVSGSRRAGRLGAGRERSTMGTVISLVGNQDPYNREGRFGPILAALHEESAFADQAVLLVAVDNPGETTLSELAEKTGRILAIREGPPRWDVVRLVGRPDRREDAFALLLGQLLPRLLAAEEPLHFITSSGTPALREAMHECWLTLRARKRSRVWRRPGGGPVQEEDSLHLARHADLQAAIALIRRCQWEPARQILLELGYGANLGHRFEAVHAVLWSLSSLESGRWREAGLPNGLPDFGQSGWVAMARGVRGPFPAAYRLRMGVQLAFARHHAVSGRNYGFLLRQAMENAVRSVTLAHARTFDFGILLDGVPGLLPDLRDSIVGLKTTLNRWVHDQYAPQGAALDESAIVVIAQLLDTPEAELRAHPLMPENMTELSARLQLAVLEAMYGGARAGRGR
ncbi:MAG: hypothetical protein KIS66_02570 [Fimbriimonadaceae bacterium]|nr:hypothetical protein [Fimbriimonadaceae bacterium]